MSDTRLSNARVNVFRLFPAATTEPWQFMDQASGESVTFIYVAKAEAGRRVFELNAPPHFSFTSRPFFDRFTATPAGLEVNRVSTRPTVFSIRPPLVLTPRDADDFVAELLPPEAASWGGADRPPCDGTAQKTASLVSVPGVPGVFVQVVSRRVCSS